MSRSHEETLSFSEYRQLVEKSKAEALRQFEISRAKPQESSLSPPSPPKQTRSDLVVRSRNAQQRAREIGRTPVYERPGTSRPRASATPYVGAAEFFNSWRKKNPELTPSEEVWQECLCDAVLMANANRMYFAREFVEDVRFYYGCWVREIELEDRWNRCQQK